MEKKDKKNKPKWKRKPRTEYDWQYKQENYSLVKVYLPIQMGEQFKEKCRQEGRTQAEVIRSAVQLFLEGEDE